VDGKSAARCVHHGWCAYACGAEVWGLCGSALPIPSAAARKDSWAIAHSVYFVAEGAGEVRHGSMGIPLLCRNEDLIIPTRGSSVCGNFRRRGGRTLKVDLFCANHLSRHSWAPVALDHRGQHCGPQTSTGEATLNKAPGRLGRLVTDRMWIALRGQSDRPPRRPPGWGEADH